MLKTKTHTTLLFLLSLSSIFVLTSCLGDDSPSGSEPELDLFEQAETYDQLSTFNEFVDNSDISSLISDSEVYTLFAPTNEAFTQLSDQVLDTLSTDQLTEVLSYHLADTALFTNEFGSGGRLTSLQGEDILITVTSNTLLINNRQLVGADIQATNGILHATSSVLFPDSYLDINGVIEKRFVLRNINTLLEATELKSTLSEVNDDGYTLFAPTNAAYEGYNIPEDTTALRDTLEYHIIPQTLRAEDFEPSQTLETLNGQELTVETEGDSITINGEANVITTDLEGTNGVAHIIDQRLTLPSN